MARNLQSPPSIFLFVALIPLLVNLCSCFNPRVLNVSALESRGFSPAVATWYGSPNGDGSDGGACGYGNIIGQAPFSSFISAGNAALFQSGKGCGACYQVKCTQNEACSGHPVTITITDECPGCNFSPVHFDLSGTAFGAMAKPGQADALRTAGLLNIEHTRIPCNYTRGTNLAFRVDPGSNPYYFACVIEYEKGDGDLTSVEIRAANWNDWAPMQQSWGATWKIQLPNGAQPPFSIRLTSLEYRKILVAENVIPPNWVPGNTYGTRINFVN
ncbi:hypothetical protein RJ639_006242 [Escallonia herrerae]|uniref:Uncharacterized protein n=1 Tax=Escallonia herrerae TaxID=1293975 RepID=A0AA88VXS8_9ASTE|nr:hypothetical protein RJ639_006242 [Escallonia herrerae]